MGALLLACVPPGAAVMAWIGSGDGLVQAELVLSLAVTAIAGRAAAGRPVPDAGRTAPRWRLPSGTGPGGRSPTATPTSRSTESASAAGEPHLRSAGLQPAAAVDEVGDVEVHRRVVYHDNLVIGLVQGRHGIQAGSQQRRAAYCHIIAPNVPDLLRLIRNSTVRRANGSVKLRRKPTAALA